MLFLLFFFLNITLLKQGNKKTTLLGSRKVSEVVGSVLALNYKSEKKNISDKDDEDENNDNYYDDNDDNDDNYDDDNDDPFADFDHNKDKNNDDDNDNDNNKSKGLPPPVIHPTHSEEEVIRRDTSESFQFNAATYVGLSMIAVILCLFIGWKFCPGFFCASKSSRSAADGGNDVDVDNEEAMAVGMINDGDLHIDIRNSSDSGGENEDVKLNDV